MMHIIIDEDPRTGCTIYDHKCECGLSQQIIVKNAYPDLTDHWECPVCSPAYAKRRMEYEMKIQLTEQQFAKHKETVCKRMSVIIVEVAKLNNVFVGKMKENGQFAPDVADYLYAMYEQAKELKIHPKLIAQAVIRKKKTPKKRFVPLRFFSGKAAVRAYQDWKRDTHAKLRSENLTGIQQGKEAITDMRLKRDQKIFDDLLAEYGDKEIAFGLGLDQFSPEWVLTFLMRNESPKTSFVKILQLMDSEKYSQVQDLL